jgi:pimeloyl-ACP methyl ester carboxylesterase
VNNSMAKTRTVPVDDLWIRYADSEAADGPVILLASPWPESLFAFRRVWPALERTGRLVAVDLPGFGHSQIRADVLTPSAMGNSSTSSSPSSGWAPPTWSPPAWARAPPCS